MTPDDVAAIRERLALGYTRDEDVTVLADALTAAWAERDELSRNAESLFVQGMRHYERAAHAEAERDLIHRRSADIAGVARAEMMAERDAALDAWHGMGDAWAVERKRADRAEADLLDSDTELCEATAALARVRDLCDKQDRIYAEAQDQHSACLLLLTPERIRAAIEGP